jgi:CheY-like chemotaxis protein
MLRPVAEPRLQNLRVLLVDDNRDTLEAYSAILGDEGAEVQSADDSRRALYAADRLRPDVLIADLSFAEEIRIVPEVRRRLSRIIPAIGIGLDKDDRGKAFEAGFQAYLRKPFQPEALIATIVRLTTAAKTA